MKHYLYFLRSKPGLEARFNDWLMNDFSPRVAASNDCTQLRINIAISPPSTDPLYTNEPREGGGFDASIDLACSDEASFERLSSDIFDELYDHTEANYGYDVEYLVEKDDEEKLKGNPSPGFKIMRGFYFYDDLSPDAARRCWDNHINLALKIHGFDRYVRYWINKPVTKDAPPIGGATNLHFSSADKLLHHYFTVPDGSAQIQQDVGHFIKAGLSRLYTEEHIIK